MHPELFLRTLQTEDFHNASELHSEHLCFSMQNIWKYVRNKFYKHCKTKTSKCIWTSLQALLIFGRKNRENAPGTSVNFGSATFPKCFWRFFYSSLLYILAVTWEWLKSWKYVLYIFEKITKLCFVKFSFVKEIASKFCKCHV